MANFNKNSERWTVPSIFGLTGLLLVIGSFNALPVWWGVLGVFFVFLAAGLWVKHGR